MCNALRSWLVDAGSSTSGAGAGGGDVNESRMRASLEDSSIHSVNIADLVSGSLLSLSSPHVLRTSFPHTLFFKYIQVLICIEKCRAGLINPLKLVAAETV